MPVTINGSTGVSLVATNSVPTAALQDSAVTTAKVAPGAIVAADLDGAQSGSAPIYGARAWVNFNGTGTVAIRGSGNVTSITDGGVGIYTVNFTTAMSDTSYSTVGACGPVGNYSVVCISNVYTASAVKVETVYQNSGSPTNADFATVCVTVLR